MKVPSHLTITVTQDHIDKGMAGSIWGCPIAGAARDIIKPDPGKSVNVGGYIYHYSSEVEARYLFPKEAIDFMRSFDAGKPVSPISFIVRLVSYKRHYDPH